MAGTFWKWLIPGLIVVAGGAPLALSQTGAPIASDLKSRAQATLDTQQFAWADIRIEGRDAVLSGTATSQRAIDDALARVAAVHGVRSVAADVVLAEFVSPFPFVATISDGKIALSGGYPAESVHEGLLELVPGAADSTRLLSGGPRLEDFDAGARFALAALNELDQGEVRLSDLSLTISGRAKSTEAYGVVTGMAAKLPPAIELAALTVAPPLAKPYVWTASFDGTNLAVSGNAPDPSLEASLRALVPANIAVSTSLVLASGAPEGFSANALKLVSALLELEQGRAGITDDRIELSGAPASSAVADATTAIVTSMGGAVSLAPPRVAEFSITVDKSADGLAFDGFVPDAATRDRLAALVGADTSRLALGRGAPDRFASGLDFGLAALDRLSEGRFELKGTRMTLGGRAASVADFRELESVAAEGAPQGLTLATAEIRPPIADPYIFSATKAASGSVTLAGYLPGDAVRASVHAAIARLAADGADPADGAPDNFAFFVGKGLEVLALLDSGKLAFDGTNWSIEGVVDTAQKGFAADAAYSAAGLRTMGWTYAVRLPQAAATAAIPTISPYIWGAQKAADGSITFTGFAPSVGFKRYLIVRAAAAIDSTVLGAGAPEDFGASAAAGLDALLALDEGALGLAGSRWTLTGEVADAATRETIQAALAGKIKASNWQIAIQARDSAPVVTPYLWSATKLPDGTVDLGGYVPNEALRDFATIRAGKLGRDTTAIASGEPAGFADDLLAGLEALSHLTDGKASFDGSRWILTGGVASQADGEAAIAALGRGSRAGSLWTTALSGYMPPAPVSGEPPSSELPAASEPSSSEPASAEPLSEAPSSEPASSEPSVPPSDAPSSEASPAEPSSSEEPAPDRGLVVVDPLPDRFVFEANKDGGQPIALSGAVPAAATAAYFGVIAGDVSSDGLAVRADLPDGFIASGTAGLTALTQLHEGRLGFDGARWWLRGRVEQPRTRDEVTSTIAGLPDGADWSVFVDVLPPIEICREKVAALERRNAITFESGSAKLTKSSLPVIDELAVDLEICADTSVHVEGHTDADGAEDLNLALSVARAEAVVEALIERGVAIERLYAEGYGESQPIASNDSRDGKAQNRRIAFSISME